MNHFSNTTEGTTNDSENQSTSQGNRIQSHVEDTLLTRNGKATGPAAKLVKRLMSYCGDPPLRLVLPNGEVVSGNGQPIAAIKIRDNRTLLALATDPLFQFGEAYLQGRLEIDGDMAECMTAIYRKMGQKGSTSIGQRVLTKLRRPYDNSLRRSKQNIYHHYDISNDFYRLWLDEEMVYTCAYFPRPGFTLEQAQWAKMDHVCRKLRLRPGMQVVEAGCGWGALALHMAKHFGVRVKAYNISREQIGWARERADQEGLNQQVEFVHDDWRNIRGQFDTFVSVGMLEHIGVKNYPRLGNIIRDCMRPEGIGLIHSIGQIAPDPMNPWIERRIFPGAYTPTLGQMMDVFERANFSVLDVENLRLHYAETLRHWLQRFEDSREQVRAEFGEQFVRMWRMYLAGSVAAFDSGYLQLFQVVFAEGTSNEIPRTREHMYSLTSDRIARVLKNVSTNGWTSNNNGGGHS